MSVLKMSEQDFSLATNNLTFRNIDFMILQKRNSYYLFEKNKYLIAKKIAINNRLHENNPDDIDVKDEISLFIDVKKCFNKYILKHRFKVHKIEERHGQQYKNINVYYDLNVGDKFYAIDIKHCFWRIAFKKGYISDKIYLKGLQPKMKLARNMALAITVSNIQSYYFRNGKNFHTIKCENEIYRQIYDNIRFTSYNLMGAMKDKYKNDVISYHTDGLTCTSNVKDMIVNDIKCRSLNVSVKEYIKIGQQTYSSSGLLKKI